MNLKMKSCKKSIFCADIRQLWIFSLIYGGMIFFSTFFDFYLNKEPYGNSIPYSFVNSRFFSYNCISNFFGFCAGAVLALILFSYLYSTSAVSFYHGLPFNRKSLFISKLSSGVLLLILPVLVNFAIVAVTKLCGSDIQIRWLSLIYWLGNQTIYSLLAFSCATFAVMLSGNVLALLVTCLLLGIAPAVIIGFAHIICQNYLLGYAYNPENFITYFYITPDILLFKARGIIYIIAIPVFLTVSYLMYKKRDLERCGEAVVFPKLKIAFIYFAGLMGGIFSYFYFSIWTFKSILFMLPFGISAVIIANMINKRGITLKGAFLHTVVFTAFVLCLLGSFRVDIIGFQNRVPIPENVESVTVTPDRYYGYRTDTSSEKYAITDIADIKKVTEYHSYKTGTGLEYQKSMPGYFKISYKLKNGRVLSRGYNVDFEGDREYLESVVALDQVKEILYPIYKAEKLNIASIDLHNFMNNVTFYPNNEITKKIIEAMNKDIETLSYDENAALILNMGNCSTPLSVDIETKNPDNDKLYNAGFYFPISFGFTNTMELLKEYDYYDRFMTVKNIAAVGIDRNDDEKGDLKIGDYTVDEIITEPEKMQDILDMLQNSYKNPVWNYSNQDQIYDEYIFLDKKGNTNPAVCLQK